MSINNIEHLESLATKELNTNILKGFETIYLIFELIKTGNIDVIKELENGRK